MAANLALRAEGARTSRSAGHHPELTRLVVEDDRAVGTADHDVLDPRTVSAGEVDPGLDAERRADRERLVVARDEVRLLVPLEADPVAGSVDELLAVPLAVDDVAGRPIDCFGRDAGDDRSRRCDLGREEDGEEVPELLRRSLACVASRDPQRPGRIAVVPA